MPTYGYKCKKCGHEFEARQSISAKALSVCPQDACTQKPWGRGRVTRQIVSGAGLLFKGSGFYGTDYRSDSYKQSAKKDVPAAPPAAETKTPAAETKPAAKAAGP
jgi:putative FmdB family regulatory protein